MHTRTRLFPAFIVCPILRAAGVISGFSVLLLTLAGSALGQPSGAGSPLIINEIMFAPPEGMPEYLEIYNRSGESVDLNGYTISDATASPTPLASTSIVVEPGGYVVLTRDSMLFAAAFPGVAAIEPERWPALNNTGDAVVLRQGAVVSDSVRYAPSWGGDGASLERKDPFGPSGAPSNWAPSFMPAGGTPGAQNSVYARDQTPPAITFAEQVSSREIDVYFDEPVAAQSQAGATFLLTGELASSTVPLSEFAWRIRVSEASLLAGTEIRLEISGVSDLTGNESAPAAVTVARLPERSDLLVNEILSDPLTDRYDGRPDQPEYVELYNNRPYTLTLRGLYWTHTPDERGDSDTLKFASGLESVGPGGFVVVYSDTSNSLANSSALALAFPDVPLQTPRAVLQPVKRASLGLRNDGDLIRLHGRDGAVLDEVRYAPDQHHPDLVDAKGVALERRGPHLHGTSTSSWGSSADPYGGTPGRVNSIHWTPAGAAAPNGLSIHPSPFSPDGDGRDDAAGIQFTLQSDGASVRLRIFDARGRLVRTAVDAGLSGRAGTYLWDGLDDRGHALPVGIYIVLADAVFAERGATETYKAALVLARQL